MSFNVLFNLVHRFDILFCCNCFWLCLGSSSMLPVGEEAQRSWPDPRATEYYWAVNDSWVDVRLASGLFWFTLADVWGHLFAPSARCCLAGLQPAENHGEKMWKGRLECVNWPTMSLIAVWFIRFVVHGMFRHDWDCLLPCLMPWSAVFFSVAVRASFRTKRPDSVMQTGTSTGTQNTRDVTERSMTFQAFQALWICGTGAAPEHCWHSWHQLHVILLALVI